MRSRWGIVLLMVAMLATLASVAMLAGCPTEEEEPMDDPSLLPPVEEVPPADPAMEPAPAEDMPAEAGAPVNAEIPADQPQKRPRPPQMRGPLFMYREFGLSDYPLCGAFTTMSSR